MKQGQIALIGASVCVLTIVLLVVVPGRESDTVDMQPPAVLTVELVRPTESLFPLRVPASGNIAPWQEAIIGAEGDGLRLTEVNVNVGDTVRRGQVLAVFDAGIVGAEHAEARAFTAQVEAEVAEAELNARRAQELDRSRVMSAQQVDQYVVGARTARARLDAARAVENRQRLRLAQTRLLAPDSGVVTARAATVGAVVPAGQELFRIIKDGRLEWRATVAVADLGKLAPGQSVSVNVQGHAPMSGTLRIISPAIDTATHDGMVYVDLPAASALRAGSFARGHVQVGEVATLTLPQGAVLLRDGFSHVLRVGTDASVRVDKVSVGRRIGDRVEILQGLALTDAVIASGVGFLSDGDRVRVVAPHPSVTRGAGS
ncbi:efflux RND transporter periplasmic adaptor subunit [Stenotrophomonas sp. CFBP 13718]|uniref:efflux RND transporter periplasmic adaptor subunit n=1 Tax=Stenotrophomonas sp. CFBP 13718 TaxID=2775304 RepID=UPI0017865BB4|nr:efflux RND transporter periplasmic adaptor subunit [Stenotrophomonas sp. CFBP 13718]MBD8696217.1 efflux RND transporter periplasmic adaptor subunit [Stenotrophomonas sp. CFBP 13718]